MPPTTVDEIEAEGLALVAAYDAAHRAVGEWRDPPPCCVQVTAAAEGYAVRDRDCPALVTLPWGDVVLAGLALPMFPALPSVWAWHRHMLRLGLEDALGELKLHVQFHGPVETEEGLYVIDGLGNLAFRSAHVVPFGVAPSAN